MTHHDVNETEAAPKRKRQPDPMTEKIRTVRNLKKRVTVLEAAQAKTEAKLGNQKAELDEKRAALARAQEDLKSSLGEDLV